MFFNHLFLFFSFLFLFNSLYTFCIFVSPSDISSMEMSFRLDDAAQKTINDQTVHGFLGEQHNSIYLNMSGKISVKRRDHNASSSSNSSLSSSGGADAAMITDLASFFECPVCFDYVLPPILQCQSGHLVCSTCRSKLTCCPTCRGPLGNIRNLAMEKVNRLLIVPIKYQ